VSSYNLLADFADQGSLTVDGMGGWDCGTGVAGIPHGSAAGPDDGFGDHGSTTPELDSWPSHVADEGILLEPPTAFPDSSSNKWSAFFGDWQISSINITYITKNFLKSDITDYF